MYSFSFLLKRYCILGVLALVQAFKSKEIRALWRKLYTILDILVTWTLWNISISEKRRGEKTLCPDVIYYKGRGGIKKNKKKLTFVSACKSTSFFFSSLSLHVPVGPPMPYWYAISNVILFCKLLNLLYTKQFNFFCQSISESLWSVCSYSRGVMSPERHVRTRLYFTSESHVHSLLSILRYGALCDVNHLILSFLWM